MGDRRYAAHRSCLGLQMLSVGVSRSSNRDLGMASRSMKWHCWPEDRRVNPQLRSENQRRDGAVRRYDSTH